MNCYFATVARGLESVVARELEGLGGRDIHLDFAGVHFTGDKALLYRVNLWARTIFRVLAPIREFPCPDAQALYREVQAIDWAEYLTPGHTLAVDATGLSPALNHTHFTALQVKNAIVDQQRKQTGERSSVDSKSPDVRLNLHIHQDRCILSRDSSGTSLHRRGYRPAMGVAPLKETLAAALLALAGWEPEMPFLDPLCGSGTLPLEAGLKSLNLAPGLFRSHFGFLTWPDFDSQCWEDLCQEAHSAALFHLRAPIFGRDQDPEVLKLAQTNAERCGLEDHIAFACCTLADLEAPAPTGVLLCNPPYGERLGDLRDLEPLYKLLGDVFKQRFKGWTAFILTGNRELAKRVGLRTAARIPVYNGALPCTLLKYELY
ncbi:THUMP domain-containing class I SAM-dependent RNA methyltransferase [Anthocerotibacter panamensis]|uniref:THUMP domain-containing class I SAM-dependent RNA methyltransferase n=1 Tax=Anthocerotibacter panamensis TaxID=2857077 RepID=UPI001C40801A